MTIQELIEAIKKVDIEIRKFDLGSVERITQLQNREFLVRKCFEQGGLTKLLNEDLLHFNGSEQTK